MSERWLGTAFYLPASDVQPIAWLQALTKRLEYTEANINRTSTRPALLFKWAGIHCEGICLEGQHRRIFLIKYLQASYFQLIDNSDTTPRAAPLLTEFIKACNALTPDFAVVITSLLDDLTRHVLQINSLMEEKSFEEVLWTRPGCVYISDTMGATELWKYPWPVEKATAGEIVLTGTPLGDWV